MDTITTVPKDIVIVLDVSASMGNNDFETGGNFLKVAKEAVDILVDTLSSKDRVRELVTQLILLIGFSILLPGVCA